MGDDLKGHWESVYRAKAPSEVSWYQQEARLSLDLIRRVAPDRGAPIVDVGGGASTLVDGLLDAGYQAVTVLDLAPTALVLAQQRLGLAAARVRWIESDVLTAALPSGGYAIWHDRAVFHFLTDASDRARYVAQTLRAVREGGYVIVASFGPEGPSRCSGLPVQRYSPTAMHAEFGAGFRLLDSVREDHRTPAGVTQAFVYCLCRIEADSARTHRPGVEQ
jgi:SAM-dependent methyltransferase